MVSEGIIEELEKIKKNKIEKSIHSDKINIIKKEISTNKIKGTIYYNSEKIQKRGVVLVHGFSHNRFTLNTLSERLAYFGFPCLSIDLPSHYKNESELSLGLISETIIDSIKLLKNQFNLISVGVVAHSIGGVGALFANLGYSINMEEQFYNLYDELITCTENLRRSEFTNKNIKELMKIDEELFEIYNNLKKLIYSSLSQKIKDHSLASCYVLVSPPMNLKKAFPGLKIIKKGGEKFIKFVFEQFFHKKEVKKILKEGNKVGYLEDEKDSQTKWKFFKTNDSIKFLDYLLNCKEPKDFLEIIENLTKLKSEEKMLNFFEFYRKRYLNLVPKLFIYGRFDVLIRPFSPFAKKRLENFYLSCGNAKIKSGIYSHIVNKNPLESISPEIIKHPEITKNIIHFLDENLPLR